MSSTYRRCCPSLTSGRRTAAGAAIRSISSGVAQPRLVGFTTANRDLNKTFEWTRTVRDGGRQSAEHHDDQRGKQTEHTEPMTAARVKSAYNQQRRNDDDRVTPVASSCLTTRSLSVPAITDSSSDDTTTDRRRRAAADRSTGMSTSVVSALVDSGVSGMQSSACTLSSTTTQLQQPLKSDVAADRVDNAVGSPPVWNLSQMSMDVRSCPDGVTLLPPLLLCQYVNGYSDAMLMHVADRLRPSWYSDDHTHAASTTATQCADDAEAESRRCGDRVESVPLSRGAQTVQTKAIVEPRRTVGEHGDTDTPCVCGQSHDLPPTHRSDLPPPPGDVTLDSPPSTTNPRDPSLPLHLLPPTTSDHCQPTNPSSSPPESPCTLR